MNFYFTYIIFFFSFFSFSQTTIIKKLGEFSELKVYNGIQLEIIKSSENKVEITGDKSEKVKIKQIENVLKFVLKFPDFSADDKVYIKLFTNNEIVLIDANEGAIITGKDINQLYLEVKAQEGSFINFVIDVKHLKVKSSSSGIIKLTGYAKNQEVDVDLYGVYHGYNLKVTENTEIKAGSGAKAEVFAGEILDAKVTFGGSIFYKGNPEIIKDKKIIGGLIRKVNIKK